MCWLISFLTSLRFFIGHITNKSAFPKPFTRAEEKICLEKFFAGDKQARDALIEHNMRLVAHIAKKYAASGCDSDDLISIGSIGLIKAVNSFSPEKSTHLATYASRCIENEILMHLRATKKQRSEVSLSEPVGTDKEGNEVTLLDILKSDGPEVPDDVERRLNIKAVLKKMNAVLDEREKKIIIMRFGLGGRKPLAQRQTAEALGISRSYVSRIEKTAIEKLRK